MVKAPSVKPLKGFLPAGDRLELHVDVSVAVGVYSDVDDLAILLVALALDLPLQPRDPIVAKLSQLPEFVG